ncbi:uncharacterized protein LOC126975300 [Leptidea sinapis]|uniref:uncharacterized protein LOC126975300 n=1 Tax=Leptidea sinapis TaxID=189913 RepID=UPI0021C46662|nr:uncharacterized protein LOC126975300 [Leptidea sinapis]
MTQNKIILGSKPKATIFSDPKLKCSPKVLLTNWEYILYNNSCYCQQCDILFPTQNTIDAHKMSVHSLLVMMPGNTARKSTTKLPHSNKAVKSTARFDTIRLYKAVKSTCKQNLKHEKPNTRIEMSENDESDTSIPAEIFTCPICSCVYINSRNFTIHAQRNHQTTKLKPLVGPYDPQCRFCKSRLYNFNSYNIHMKNQHPEKCVQVHSNSPKRKLQVSSERKHKIIKLNNEPQLKSPKVMPNNIDVPVPIGVLFKCDKCSLHFTTGLVAFFHSVHCVQSPGEWKCPQCDRFFRKVDQNMHRKQHEVSESFSVVPYSKDLPRRVVCRCLNCGVCYDERNFAKYHAVGCGQGHTVPCPTCNLKIHESSVAKHLCLHAKNLSIFMVDYITAEVNVKQARLVNNEIAKPKATPKPKIVQSPQTEVKREKFKISLYCCTKCDTYFRVRKEVHVKGRCFSMQKRFCKICGLTFSIKGMMTHLKDHQKMNGLSLKDFRFLDLNTSEAIKPPMPKYLKCQQCHVKFFGRPGLRGHTCFEEKFKRCKKCNEEFSDLAYKLHLAFHDYNMDDLSEDMPELMKKYISMQSLWNIVYHCVICDIILDKYDTVVEHSQNHFCNMESYGVNIMHCEKCDLNFDEPSYKRHRTLHKESNISKTSLMILNFDYNKLLTDDWLDMFSELSMEQRRHILAKSIYDIERGVRLTLIQDGPSNPTLYKCSTCELFVDPSTVLEHAHNRDACAETTQIHQCSICKIPFFNKSAKLAHEFYHSVDDFSSLRIVRFNSKNDYDINFALSKVPAKDSLKFIWCQQCGLLVKKIDYKKHLLKHNSAKMKPSYKIPKKGKISNASYVFYQCVRCQGCVLHLHNINQHSCRNSEQYICCNICGVKYLKNFAKSHQQVHLTKPKLSRSTVKFIKFKDGRVIPEKHTKSSFSAYQCTNCGTCVHQKKQLYLHSCQDRSRTCQICNLKFRGHKYHKTVHAKYPDLKVKDLNIIPFNSDKSETSETPEIVPKKRLAQPTRRLIDYMSGKGTRTRFQGDLNKISDKNRFRCIKSVMYKCDCNLLFIRRSSLLVHIPNCSKDRLGIRCDVCHLIFHRSSIEEHRLRQKCSESKFYCVSTVEVGCSDTDDENKWLKLCKECGVYYSSERGIVGHFDNNHLIKRFRDCSPCDIKFSSLSYQHHVLWHHTKNNYTVKDLNIDTFVKLSVQNLCQMEVSYEEAELDINSDGDDITIIDDADTTNDLGGDEVEKVSVEEENVDESDTEVNDDNKIIDIQNNHMVADAEADDVLYKCVVCGVHYMSASGITYHMNNGNHKKISRAKCTLCNLFFTKNIIPKHRIKHHKNDEPNTNFVVKLSSEVVPIRSIIPLSFARCLFKCGVCDLHFMYSATARTHLKIGDHNTSKVLCSECQLYFTEEVIEKHKVKHHIDFSFTRDDYTIKVIHPNDAAHRDDTAQMGVETLGTTLKTDPDRTRKSYDDKRSKLNPANSNLFKCAECDVYFVVAEMCFDHVRAHTPLDPTEYIACKICDLQILCESLGVHMRTHRENSFNIDELVVTEYRPAANGAPTSDTYLAAERLKSKLITTTTDFGSDEKY